MTGQIPKYGEWFRRISVPRDFDNDLAHTAYVLKANGIWSIRANGNSEKWYVFLNDVSVSGPWPVMRDAMRICRELETIATFGG